MKKNKEKNKFQENQGNSACKHYGGQALPKAHKTVKMIDSENEPSV